MVQKGTRKTKDHASYAIKVVTKVKILEEVEARLMEEIGVLQELHDHENILALRDVYEEPEAYYLVTDLMVGGDLLSRLVLLSFLPEVHARGIVKMILEAVRYMHSFRIVHRDLKPGNILMVSDNVHDFRIKLADFGFAKKEVAAPPDSFRTICGTLPYAAPEVLNAQPYGSKADMWSIGVCCFAMLAGCEPFEGECDEEIQFAVKKGDYVFHEEFFSAVSDEAKDFIATLLAVQPKARASAESALASPWFHKELAASQ